MSGWEIVGCQRCGPSKTVDFSGWLSLNPDSELALSMLALTLKAKNWHKKVVCEPPLCQSKADRDRRVATWSYVAASAPCNHVHTRAHTYT